MKNRRVRIPAQSLASLSGLLNLADAAGNRDDKKTKKLIEAACYSEDSDLVSTVAECLSGKAIKRQVNGPCPPPEDEIPGDVILGYIHQTGLPVGIYLHEIQQGGVLISGRTGSGKTTACAFVVEQLLDEKFRDKVYNWAFETAKNTFRHIMPRGTLIVPYKLDRFNPMREPPGVDPLDWDQIFCEITAETFGLKGASKHMALKITGELHDIYGTFRGSNIRPTLLDVHKLLTVKRKKASRVDIDYIDRWLNKLEPFASRLPNVVGVDQGFPLEELVGSNVVWELTGLTAEMQTWFVNLKSAWKLAYKMAHPEKVSKLGVNIFDEGSKLLGRREEWTGDEPFIFQMFRRGREYGETMIVCEQMISSLGDAVVANTFCKICLNQASGNDIRFIKECLYLDREQAGVLNKLGIGQAILKLSDRMTYPVLVDIPRVEFGYVSDEEINKTIEESLKTFTTIPRVDLLGNGNGKGTPASPVDAGEADKGQRDVFMKKKNVLWHNILKNVVDRPYVGVATRYQVLKINAWRGSKAVREMVEVGLIISHKFGFGRKGDKTRYLEITEAGCRYAGIDAKRATLRGKGSFDHKLVQYFLARHLRSKGHKPLIEMFQNGKAVDVGYIDVEKNEAVAVEIELDPEEPHVVENLKKDIEAGFNRIIILTRDEEAGAKIKGKAEIIKITEKLNKEGLQTADVKFGLIKDYI